VSAGLLEESKILVVARMVAISLLATEMATLRLAMAEIASPVRQSSAARRNEYVRFGGALRAFKKNFARVVPAADVHHADAALVMLLGGSGILFRGRPSCAARRSQVHAGAIGELFAGAFQDFFSSCLDLANFC